MEELPTILRIDAPKSICLAEYRLWNPIPRCDENLKFFGRAILVERSSENSSYLTITITSTIAILQNLIINLVIKTDTLGTWIPLEAGRMLAERNNVFDKLRPIFEFIPSNVSPPPAPKHGNAANRSRAPRLPKKPSKPLASSKEC